MGDARRFLAVSRCGLLAVAIAWPWGSAQANHGFDGSCAAAQTASFEVLHHRVILPPHALPGRGCFVAAHDASLRATLNAAGLIERRTPCDAAHASCPPAHSLVDATFALGGDPKSLSVRLVRLLALSDGQSLWWAEATQEPLLFLCGPQRTGVDLWPLFADGTARVTSSVARGGPMEGGAPPPRVVDLRHAAVELKIGETQAPRGEAAVCAPYDLLPTPGVVPAGRSAVWHVPTRKKRLALTFDACSTYQVGRFNPAVIATLQAQHIPATLFIGGHWAEMFPDELNLLAHEPLFELGNHTYSHPHMRDLPPKLQAQELLWTQQIIHARTGVLPRFFRPPYGEVDDEMIAEVARAGLVTVEYDLPAGDADVHVSAARLSQWVEGQISPGSVVIMHMNRPGNHTAEALVEIARELRARGYMFCRMSSLLDETDEGCL